MADFANCTDCDENADGANCADCAAETDTPRVAVFFMPN